jgi:hypothetical protein
VCASLLATSGRRLVPGPEQLRGRAGLTEVIQYNCKPGETGGDLWCVGTCSSDSYTSHHTTPAPDGSYSLSHRCSHASGLYGARCSCRFRACGGQEEEGQQVEVAMPSFRCCHPPCSTFAVHVPAGWRPRARHVPRAQRRGEGGWTLGRSLHNQVTHTRMGGRLATSGGCWLLGQTVVAAVLVGSQG